MKIIFSILLIVQVTYAHAQKKGVEIDLSIYCGFGAYTSDEIKAFKNLVTGKDTLTIRHKLFNGAAIEQIMSTIVLMHYHKNGPIKLSKREADKMFHVSNWRNTFLICYTCTFQQKGTVKQLFNRKKYLASYSVVEDYLFGKL